MAKNDLVGRHSTHSERRGGVGFKRKIYHHEKICK